MKDLFESTALGGVRLKNRLVRSATFEGMAGADGGCTDRLTALYRELAEGGAGLIITGHAFVEERGRAAPRQIGVHEDEMVRGLERIAAAVHRVSQTALVLQLAHAGVYARSKKTPLDADATSRELGEVRRAFTDAAVRALRAGFDGVQLHAAHGYLLSQLLSPMFNRRTDAYGSDAEGRARLLGEIIEEIRCRTAEGFLLTVKLNCEDFTTGGLTREDALLAGRLIAEKGAHAVELSGGLLTDRTFGPSRKDVDREQKEAYFQEQAMEFRKRVEIPLILVGGIRSYRTAKRLLDGGCADYLSLSRPLIREPGLVKRWMHNDRSPSRCNSDNLCLRAAVTERGVYCVTAERELLTNE